ncbi:MAG: TonB family protein [Bacteroidetes bacterium]|nr:TonB family protein [Bacteroidota bacterium]
MKTIKRTFTLLICGAVLFGCARKTLKPSNTAVPQKDFNLKVKENGYVKNEFNGKTISEGAYKDSLKTGKWIYYNEKGQAHINCNYQDGELHGPYTMLHPNDSVRFECIYVVGQRDGLATAYFDNGLACQKINYQKGDKYGENTHYYRNGKERLKQNFVNDTLNGDAFEFYKSGQLKSKAHYKMGKQHGLVYNYYENGRIINLIQMKNGKIDSVFNQYLVNGLEDPSYKIVNGNGIVKSYYGDGKLKAIYSYRNGKKKKKTKILSHSGQPLAVEHYKAGKPHGLMLDYDKNGKLENEGYAENGIKVGKWSQYDSKKDEYVEKEYEAEDSVYVSLYEDTTFYAEFKQNEIMPAPHGGINAFYRWLGSNVIYPQAEREMNIEGTVYVLFIVGRTGEIENVGLQEGTEELNTENLNRAAIKAIEKSPSWLPGIQQNIPVRVYYKMPVMFKLESPKKPKK